MIQDLKFNNWIINSNPQSLHKIHESGINISIFKRNISNLNNEINLLVNSFNSLSLNGTYQFITNSIKEELNKYPLISEDINSALLKYKEITKAKKFRLLFSTINSNMCKIFHADFNSVRLLCTYRGPGTLWLKKDNINREALNTRKGNDYIVINKKDIQQIQTGAIALLKGEKYSKFENGVIHKSPEIKEKNSSRLLLRIDTNEFLNF